MRAGAGACLVAKQAATTRATTRIVTRKLLAGPGVHEGGEKWVQGRQRALVTVGLAEWSVKMKKEESPLKAAGMLKRRTRTLPLSRRREN